MTGLSWSTSTGTLRVFLDSSLMKTFFGSVFVSMLSV